MVENPNRPIKKMTWEMFDQACKTLSEVIKVKFPNIKYIYGVPRGGLPLAVKLSHLLDLKLITEELDLDVFDNVLIVDDISDSGTTLSDIITNIDGKTPIVCIFKRETTELGPDLVFETIKDEWIQFPWEV